LTHSNLPLTPHTQPSPASHTLKPSPASHTLKPSPASHTLKPSPPSPASHTLKPSPASHTLKPSPASHTLKPSPASHTLNCTLHQKVDFSLPFLHQPVTSSLFPPHIHMCVLPSSQQPTRYTVACKSIHPLQSFHILMPPELIS
uniref:Uncharacterized protein n=1 Tax=Eptatretus burgeri TaxID=7764 RepID=A0A8C4QAM4_EPTBU